MPFLAAAFHHLHGILAAAPTLAARAPGSLLERGDVICRVNRPPVSTLYELGEALAKLRASGVAALLVERQGSLHYIEVPLE